MNRFWQNFSLDTYVQPQVNSFLETNERLPDVRLTGQRQQLWDTPVYYESENSAGYYRHQYGTTNGMSTGLNYEAARVDTYQKLLLPADLLRLAQRDPARGRALHLLRHRHRPGRDDRTT